MKKVSVVLVTALVIVIAVVYVWHSYGISIPPKDIPTDTKKFTVPEVFSFEIFGEVPNARTMAFDPHGTLLVSSYENGKIVALVDTDADGISDEQVTVVENLNLPHGFAFRCADPLHPDLCQLYVAEQTELSVFAYDSDTRKASNKTKLVDLPGNSLDRHKTRSLLFLPVPNENKLLISVGSSCNVCTEKDQRQGAVLVYDINDKTLQTFASGLRNSVFMTLHPVSGDVVATEMGRDGLGDDIPPDEINILKQSANYGWPICYGKNIHDTEFDTKTYIRNPCMEPFETPSLVDIPAHSAPLGLAYIPEEGWDESLWFDLLVAYHGSWNRSEPTGYKVVRMEFDTQGKHTATHDFVTGWLTEDGTKLGRPADILVLPGGVVYISDDEAGRVYRMSR